MIHWTHARLILINMSRDYDPMYQQSSRLLRIVFRVNYSARIITWHTLRSSSPDLSISSSCTVTYYVLISWTRAHVIVCQFHQDEQNAYTYVLPPNSPNVHKFSLKSFIHYLLLLPIRTTAAAYVYICLWCWKCLTKNSFDWIIYVREKGKWESSVGLLVADDHMYREPLFPHGKTFAPHLYYIQPHPS